MKPHLLHFPCRNAVYDWFGELSGSGILPVTVDLLAEQREFELQPAHREERVTCHHCGPQARYVICLRRGQTRDKLFPRRFPDSQSTHKPGCFSYTAEFRTPETNSVRDEAATAHANGDFAALKHPLSDPEFSIAAMRKRNSERPDAGQIGDTRSARRMAIGLQRLARELLQRSGLCDWRPAFAGVRNERVFNGRIKGAIAGMIMDGNDAVSAVLRSLSGSSLVPWSYLAHQGEKTPPGMTACVGFGFIEALEPENQHGSRRIRLRNYSACPVVIPRRILDREGRNPRSALLSFLAHPTWAIFVAGQYDGIWKAHALSLFRVSDVALIPIESHFENQMVEHLVAQGRTFRRWLLPPPEFAGRRLVPDLQLLDRREAEYIEVAGLMSSPDYADIIRRKCAILGNRLLVWDAARARLGGFVLPPPEANGTTYLRSKDGLA